MVQSGSGEFFLGGVPDFLKVEAFVFALVLGLFRGGFLSSERGVTGEQKMKKRELSWNGVIVHHFEHREKKLLHSNAVQVYVAW